MTDRCRKHTVQNERLTAGLIRVRVMDMIMGDLKTTRSESQNIEAKSEYLLPSGAMLRGGKR